MTYNEQMLKKIKSGLQLAWVLLYSGGVMLYYCTASILVSFFGKNPRHSVNRYLSAWAIRLINIIRLRYQIYNPHRVHFKPNKRYIVMCNHTSLYDIPLSVIALGGSLRMIAKKELSRIPIFGLALKKNDFFFIDRKNRERAIQDLKKASETMKSGIILWIAPEGTRSKDGQLLPFKKGGFVMAIESQALIIPLGIRGALNILPHKTFKINCDQAVELHIGKPIDSAQYTPEQRDDLIQTVRTEIQKAADL